MCSYNQINGLPSCENPTTLGDIKNGTGFDGFVVPDFLFAVRNAVAAAKAGVDLPALPGNGGDGLTVADFTSGAISAARLDDIDRRILFALFDSGLFDNPLRDAHRPRYHVGAPAGGHQGRRGRHRAAQERSAVLPLSDHVRSIALVGPTGNDAVFVSGGSAGVPLASGQAITPLAGISARAARPGSRSTQSRARPATSLLRLWSRRRC